ncbi:MAG: Holliday junction resolvase RuvX [Dehalococcoidia bacterium]|nr:Holliday junction resolvase RuvX [Dehalococcoidia bacterium]MSQ16365.1 Holliday junction resolvase RuvX [Dehalococcoidia bacterium]
MKLLGLDLGGRRIGLAVCDAAFQGKDLALPIGHLVRTRLAQDVDRLLELARQRQVEGFVVGVPYRNDRRAYTGTDAAGAGLIGPQAKQSLGFIRELKKHTALPVYSVDEGFTSVQAEDLLRQAGRQPSRERSAVDEAAAALILQRFLDQQRPAQP